MKATKLAPVRHLKIRTLAIRQSNEEAIQLARKKKLDEQRSVQRGVKTIVKMATNVAAQGGVFLSIPTENNAALAKLESLGFSVSSFETTKNYVKGLERIYRNDIAQLISSSFSFSPLLKPLEVMLFSTIRKKSTPLIDPHDINEIVGLLLDRYHFEAESCQIEELSARIERLTNLEPLALGSKLVTVVAGTSRGKIGMVADIKAHGLTDELARVAREIISSIDEMFTPFETMHSQVVESFGDILEQIATEESTPERMILDWSQTPYSHTLKATSFADGLRWLSVISGQLELQRIYDAIENSVGRGEGSVQLLMDPALGKSQIDVLERYLVSNRYSVRITTKDDGAHSFQIGWV